MPIIILFAPIISAVAMLPLAMKDAEKVRQVYKSLIDRIEENDYILFTELELLENSEDENSEHL